MRGKDEVPESFTLGDICLSVSSIEKPQRVDTIRKSAVLEIRSLLECVTSLPLREFLLCS